MTDMPRFDFSGISVTTDEELQNLQAPRKSTSKVFQPGLHEVTISAMEYRGAPKGDASWIMFGVTYTGSSSEKGGEGKEIRETILVPTKDIKYGEKQTVYPFTKLQTWCKALGVTLSIKTLQKDLATLFSDVSKLIGSNLAITVGYENASVGYTRSKDGSVAFFINKRNGSALTDEAGKTLTFPDRDAAQAYMDEAGIKYDAFPSVVGHSLSATPNRLKSNDNW